MRRSAGRTWATRCKAGQVLAQLDPQDLQLGQDAARAALAAAQVNCDQAAADFKRFKELHDQGFISAAELERRETTLKAAQAQLEQARAQASVQGNQAALCHAGRRCARRDHRRRCRAGHGGRGRRAGGAPGARRPARRGVRGARGQGRPACRRWPAQPGALQGAPVGRRRRRRCRRRCARSSAAADPATRTFLVKADIGSARGVRLGQTATVLVELPRDAGVTKLPLSALKEEQGKQRGLAGRPRQR